jgi:phosphatidylglycerophosphatase A
MATGFGAGYLPVMPGTYGSAEGVVLFLALGAVTVPGYQGFRLLVAAVVLLAAASLWVIAKALPNFSSEDPPAIVLDEVAGQALTLLVVPLLPSAAGVPWLAVGAGFFLFRIFDTLKPYPIWKLGHFKGALGVLADDLGAGAAAAAVLYALGRWVWQ